MYSFSIHCMTRILQKMAVLDWREGSLGSSEIVLWKSESFLAWDDSNTFFFFLLSFLRKTIIVILYNRQKKTKKKSKMKSSTLFQ